MTRTEFAIRRFENHNSAISWHVTGWRHGVRIRKNFKTREEAAAEKGTLEIQSIQVPDTLLWSHTVHALANNPVSTARRQSKR
jgi:hypothetical protein